MIEFTMGEETIDDLMARLMEMMDAGAMLTKFVILIEGIDSSGARAAYITTDRDSTPWDNLGLLEYGVENERNKMRRE